VIDVHTPPFRAGFQRITSRKTRVGLVSGGLAAYWTQFPDLLSQLQQSARRVF
jgi:L-arabinose isomerase